MKLNRLFACLAVLVLLSAMLPAAGLAETYATVTTESDVLHLRDYPGTDGAIIGRYRSGTKVEILSSLRNWAQVKTPDGQVGYMYKKYLSAYASVSGEISYGSGVTRYIRQGIGPVNIRRNASVESKLLDRLDGGTSITLLSQGETWSRIKLANGRLGWVKTQFLTKTR